MTMLTFDYPADLFYFIEHQVWARIDGAGIATVGITELGIRLSGEIYMCRPKRAGTVVAQGASLGVVELAKSIVSVKTPVSGEIVLLNAQLEQRPELVHFDPYGEGWIARLRLSGFEADRAQLVHGAEVAAAMAEYAQAMGLDQPPGVATGRL